MRHGFRGAAEIVATVDNLFAYAALGNVTDDSQFDLLFDATIGDQAVRNFMIDANPVAARAMAERFDEAIQRGFWTTRRNSTNALLARMQAAA